LESHVSGSFFEEQQEQSLIKAEIVTKYFAAWAKVIISAQKVNRREDRVAYIDLFAGPGRYRNGSSSTPILILETALKDADLSERLVAIFNDKDAQNTKSLQAAIDQIEGIGRLKHRPQVYTGEVTDALVQQFEKRRLVPTFLFVDPFGYKGLSLDLVNSVLKDWGCDCVFFFNYNRISMGMTNPAVEDHMNVLFGKQRADRIRRQFESHDYQPHEREAFIVEEMQQALREQGGQHVLPFRFRNPANTRTTHHLFFVSKAFRGYDIMRGIMYLHSLKEQGVARFEYNPADRRCRSLFEYLRPLEDLEELLLTEFAGKTMRFTPLYEQHSVGRPYVKANYREVLCRMEQEGKITMTPSSPPRRSGTIGDKVQITFPRRTT
jgi:three-Cys-motif partner protein